MKKILTNSLSLVIFISANAEAIFYSEMNTLVHQFEKTIRDSFQATSLVKRVDLEKKKSIGNTEADIIFRVSLPGEEKVIIAQCKSTGQPRFARQATNQLYYWRQQFPGSYGIFAAPYISPKSAEICKEAGVGYVDLAGNCLLNFGGLYVRIEGRENPFPQNRELRTIFSPKSSRVLRVLLMNPFKSWKVAELKERTEVSLGQVSNVKKALLDREWAEEKETGFTLSQPEALLRAWASNYQYRKNRKHDFYSLQEGPELEREVSHFCKNHGIRFALTMFSGAARIAPYTRFQRIFAYVERGIDEIQNALQLKPVGSGPNVTLIVPHDSGVFIGAKAYGQIPVVSPIQLYLDLKSYKGRGEEAAEFLFEKVIESSWSQKQTMDSGK